MGARTSRAGRQRRPSILIGAIVAFSLLLAGTAAAAPNDNAIPEVDATWDCDDGITVTSTKALSNLVLLVDGEPVRIYERGDDDPATNTYDIDPATVDGAISGIYIKSGANGVRGPQNRGFGEFVELTEPDCGPVLATGEIQATLRWHSDADLDLEVTDPAGDTVWWFNPTVPSGGFLDVDSNVFVCGMNVPPAVENIVWPDGQAIDGTYTVRVVEYHLCDEPSPEWHLVVKVGGVVVIDVTSTGPFSTTFDYPSP